MRSDVHFAALKAAAKLAFSVALLNGCASQDGAAEDEAEGTGKAESDVIATSPKPPCHDDAGPAKPSCAAILASAFGTPDGYPGHPTVQSAEVMACCNEELTGELSGLGARFRWDCCAARGPITPIALDLVSDAGPIDTSTFSTHAMACTPWGPPVPPSMNRDRLARRRALRSSLQAAA